MDTILKEKLWAYIISHNPELMFTLQEEYSVTRYLDEKIKSVTSTVERLLDENKPIYIIEELCLNELTEDLKPSRFLYLKGVLEDEFPDEFEKMRESGVLTYELVNMIADCEETFTTFGFSTEKETDRHLRYAIIARIHDFLLR